ncbi:hypothetical protein [Streptomyces sp. NBC_01601]|uniref:hypothetical protein n=1 Tax=Streptomyces sp. NBC_01601 TaxID=2975892 RepID=UPI002E295740|nr:hypothetical protein [Streptomyces sp. NBC_01601]
MAKADRNASARAAVTGENYAQALRWIREHGLTDGLAPDAAGPEQEALEAALLYVLARPRGPLAPLAGAGSLFGIAKSSPSTDGLALWPSPGAEGELLARLLPARSQVAVSGTPGVRWSVDSAKYLALTGPGTARVRIAAARNDVRRAAEIVAGAGLVPLWNGPVSPDEEASWVRLRAGVGDDGPGWSRALRRPALAREVMAVRWDSSAPRAEDLAGAGRALAPRPHGPVTGPHPEPRVILVSAERGGLGCTTMSVSLAFGLVRAGLRVALLTHADGTTSSLQDAEPATTAWFEALSPADAPPLLVADTGRFGEDTGQLLSEARERAEVVIVDSAPPHRLDEVDADLTIVVDRHRPADWSRTDVTDRRPSHIRTFEWLDTLLPSHRSAAEQTEVNTVMARLDSAFLAYVLERIDEPDDPDVYDAEDAEDIEFFWDLDAWGSGHTEDLLPAEETVPLGQWRADFIGFLDAEGQRRYPKTWAAVRAGWAERNRRRNQQRLGTAGDDLADLLACLEAFAAARDAEADPRWVALGADQQRAWRAAQLIRWLDERFDAYVRADAAHHKRTELNTVLAVLDARFLSYVTDRAGGQDPAQSLPPASDGREADQWWEPAAAARHADAMGLPWTREDSPLELWRAEFLDAVQTEGQHRFPALWPQVRTRWAEHNGTRTAAGLAPFQATAAEREQMRPLFVHQVGAIGADAWGPSFAEHAARWVSGHRSDAERVEEFAELIERRQRPAAAAEVADSLLGALRRTPGTPWVLLTNYYRPTGTSPDPGAVGDELARRGVDGFCAVRQLRPLEKELFEPISWNDSRSRQVQADLAAAVQDALALAVPLGRLSHRH